MQHTFYLNGLTCEIVRTIIKIWGRKGGSILILWPLGGGGWGGVDSSFNT